MIKAVVMKIEEIYVPTERRNEIDLQKIEAVSGPSPRAINTGRVVPEADYRRSISI